MAQWPMGLARCHLEFCGGIGKPLIQKQVLMTIGFEVKNNHDNDVNDGDVLVAAITI